MINDNAKMWTTHQTVPQPATSPFVAVGTPACRWSAKPVHSGPPADYLYVYLRYVRYGLVQSVSVAMDGRQSYANHCSTVASTKEDEHSNQLVLVVLYQLLSAMQVLSCRRDLMCPVHVLDASSGRIVVQCASQTVLDEEFASFFLNQYVPPLYNNP